MDKKSSKSNLKIIISWTFCAICLAAVILYINVYYERTLITLPEHLKLESMKSLYLKSVSTESLKIESNKYLKMEPKNITNIHMKFKKPEYLSNYASPCWRDSSRLYCLSAMYFAGFPKCGTSTLNSLIAHLPNTISKGKGCHWWSVRQFKSPLTKYGSVAANKANKNSIVYDPSPSTVFYNLPKSEFGKKKYSETQKRNSKEIYHLTPHAKIILSLRNPVDRLYSHYYYENKRKTSQTSPQNFHKQVLIAIKRWEECLKDHSENVCIYHKEQLFIYSFNSLRVELEISIFVLYIEDWLRSFPRDQLHIVRFEDLVTNASAVMQGVCRFLDIKCPNAGKTILQRNARKSGDKAKGDMLQKTRNLLEKFYQPYNDRLAALMRNPIYKWKTK